MAVFYNPAALPRAFAPRRLRRVEDARRLLQELAAASDFRETVWLAGPGAADEPNGEATVDVRASGADLIVEVRARGPAPALIATSIPDWPGWRADEGDRSLPTLTVNHAFVGIALPPGNHTVRLAYRPRSWNLGLAAGLAGVLAAAAVAIPRAPETVETGSSRIRDHRDGGRGVSRVPAPGSSRAHAAARANSTVSGEKTRGADHAIHRDGSPGRST